MESSPKEQDNGRLHNPDEQKTNADADVSHDSKSSELSQLELMNQWRCNLKILLEDLGISVSDSVTANESQDITPEIAEKLDYLKKTDVLLQQYDDFALSGTGFEKYKVAHLAAVNFLTQLYRQKEKQKEEKEEREQEKDKKPVKFYFFSHAEHIQQQFETIPWKFTFFHFILLLITTVAFVKGAILITELTQNNGIVRLLLIALFLTFINMAKNEFKNHRASALTPIRFSISSLSIISLTSVIYALIFIVIPDFITWKYKPFWHDDVMIIGLGVFTFIMFGISQDDRETAKLGDDHESKALEDSVKAVDIEITK